MSEHPELRDAEAKDFLAQLGLALLNAQALEYSLVTLFAASKEADCDDADRLDVRTLMDARYAQTLGRLVRDAVDQLGLHGKLASDLEAALVRRNWLVHGMYRDCAAASIDPRIRKKCRDRIIAFGQDFVETAEAVNLEARKRILSTGMGEEELQEHIETAIQRYLESPNV